MQFRFWKQVGSGLVALNATTDVTDLDELQGVRELAYYVLFTPLTSAGAFQVETAHLKTFTGTWAPEGSPVAWVAANRVHVLRITGFTKASRLRVSTAIVDGTGIDVYIGGN